MARVQFCLLLLLTAAHVRAEPLSCPDIGTVGKNDWAEDRTGYMTSSGTAAGVTSVSWAPYDDTSAYIDVTPYVDVSYNQTAQVIDFTALPSMAGVRDYPAKGFPQLIQLGGICRITCGRVAGEFEFLATVIDQNTADPVFDSSAYNVDIEETFPVGSRIPSLVLSASDADADAINHELSFTLQDGIPFGLTEAVKTGDVKPTYTTQLVLNEALDWATAPSYQLTVTAKDRGGRSAQTTVTVTVIDVDTQQPEFDQAVFTATVEDPASLGAAKVRNRTIDTTFLVKSEHVLRGTTAECPDIGTVRKNNWPEDKTGYMTSSPNAAGVISVSWAPYDDTSDYIDVTPYVDVSYNQTAQVIDFTALPSMSGVRDYPAKGFPQLAQLGGVCRMTCGTDTGEFEFIATVTDRNTADPAFSSPTYSVDISETFPTGLTVPGLVVSASDADADATNYELSFTLQEGSPFSLTETVKTGDVIPTYTVQLKLDGTLDYVKEPSYDLTITAEDPGGRSAQTTVTVTVIDVDTQQPEFDQAVYTATVEDPAGIGPLNVTIRATDPDAPGKLTYELQDTFGGKFDGYFSLDPDTAELSLTKDITGLLEPYPTTAPFLLQATEDGGYGFSCRAELLISLPQVELTTTPAPEPQCPAMSSVVISDWPEDKTGSIVSCDAPGVTHVSWKPSNSSGDYIDISRYVEVAVNTWLRVVEFTALPTMYGIVDFGSQTYPNPVTMEGTCLLECGNDRAEFQFTLQATDADTAAPAFSSADYAVYVRETFPVGLVIGNLVISASDADADKENYELSFALQEGSPFNLTGAMKTSDVIPTYTTQLVLNEPLDWATNSLYQLTTTATDPKGQHSEATVKVHIIKADTVHPAPGPPSAAGSGADQ